MNFFEEGSLTYFWEKIQNFFLKKNNVFNAFFPVGSIYCTVNNVSPGTYLGGTWELCCLGETIIGVNETEEEFENSNMSGGEKEHVLTMEEMPSHNHGQVSLTGWAGSSSQQSSGTAIGVGGIFSLRYVSATIGYGKSTKNVGYDGFNANATHTHTTVGTDTAHNNLQPYITCYIWTRTE